MSQSKVDERYLYKTAFSLMFQCQVSIDHVHADTHGELIFTGSNQEENLNQHLFREQELSSFSLS